MKVLFFANTDWYLYNFRLRFASFLRERGIQVVMASPHGAYGPRIEAAGFRWFPLAMDRRSLNPVYELKLLQEILDIFRAERPDAIHNFTMKCVVYGSLVARWFGTERHINAVTGLGHIFIHDSPRTRLLRLLVKSLLKPVLSGSESRLILQNPDDVRLFSKLGLIEDKRVRLIRGSGVDTARFAPFERHPGEPFRVLLASRLLWEKGVREYLEAAERLRSRTVKFLLAGALDRGNPSAVSEADIARWNKAGVVQVLGYVDDMADLLRTVDLVVLPSYREGAPKGLIEAAAMGLPIIATDVPGCREIVDHGVNGFLVPVRDAAALSRRIEYLLDTPDVCRRFGAAGRKKVLEEFDERIVFQKTYAVYQELGGL